MTEATAREVNVAELSLKAQAQVIAYELTLKFSKSKDDLADFTLSDFTSGMFFELYPFEVSEMVDNVLAYFSGMRRLSPRKESKFKAVKDADLGLYWEVFYPTYFTGNGVTNSDRRIFPIGAEVGQKNMIELQIELERLFILNTKPVRSYVRALTAMFVFVQLVLDDAKPDIDSNLPELHLTKLIAAIRAF